MSRTHRLVSGSTAFVLLTGVGVPVAVSAGAAGVAAYSATWPDDVERPLRLRHRGPSHWPSVQLFFLSLPSVAAEIWLPAALLYVAAVSGAAWLGCVWHSCADAMTVESRGIQLLWPISRRGFHLLPRFMRVWVGGNSRSEKVFLLAWSALVISYIYVRYRNYIVA